MVRLKQRLPGSDHVAQYCKTCRHPSGNISQNYLVRGLTVQYIFMSSNLSGMASYPSLIQPTQIWHLVTWGTRQQHSCLLSPCSWPPWWRHAPWTVPWAPRFRLWSCRLCHSSLLVSFSPGLPSGSSPYPLAPLAPLSLPSRLSAFPAGSPPLPRVCCRASFPFSLFSPSHSSLCPPVL